MTKKVHTSKSFQHIFLIKCGLKKLHTDF